MEHPSATAEIGTLFTAHAKWLEGWLLRRTRCPERAGDLAQDAFCRLLEQPTQITPHAPRGLLATIARRLLIDDIRRRDVERAYLACYGAHHGDVDDLTPERIAAAAQLLDGIVRLLSALPDQARQAFLLRKFDGLSHDEIAGALGVSVRTVKRHIAQAYVQCYAFAFPA